MVRGLAIGVLSGLSSVLPLIACSTSTDPSAAHPGGSNAFGGSSGATPSGATNGGGLSGGTSGSVAGAGGVAAAGGSGSGGGMGPSGVGGGGTASGGASTGGASTGGAASGGASTGGASSGSACSKPSASPAVTDLAFPEAQGFGQHATGGRNGTVYHVTNLNDSGAGSFRDAVSQPNRIVVFDVAGYIALGSAVSAKSNLTIAGQTAPGGGIGFSGGELSFANSSNIILRFVRVRPGSKTTSDTDDALSLYRAHNVIVDHSSFEFAPWNNIDAVSDDWQNFPVTDITFQDNLIADPTGQQFGAHTESVSSQWAWYRNIFANSHNRNPLAKVNNVFVNNVLYNCSAGYTTHTSTEFQHDIVANYFIFGPASTGTDNTWFQIDKNQSLYYSGNLKDTNLNGLLDGAGTTPYWYQGTGTVLSAPWSPVTGASAAYDAASAYRIATSLAGPLPRDLLDALVVSQVRTLGKGTTGTGTGTVGPGSALYTSQTETGLSNDGYGEIASGTKATDTDGDGMPDFWEQVSGSDPKVVDAMQKAPDGYALIEHYLNWLAEPHASATAGSSVDVDLSTFAFGFSDVAPVFAVSAPACGSVQLLPDGHRAHFTPASGFVGLSSFRFTVTGSDHSAYTASVAVAVPPS